MKVKACGAVDGRFSITVNIVSTTTAGRTLRPNTAPARSPHDANDRSPALFVARPFMPQKRPQPLAACSTIPDTSHAHRDCRSAFRATSKRSALRRLDPCGVPTPPAKSCRRDNRPQCSNNSHVPLADALQAFRSRIARVDHRLKIGVSDAPSTMQASHLQYIFARSQVTTP